MMLVKTSRFTPWHLGNVKPEIIGVYQRKNGFYSKWNGKQWMKGSNTAYKADAATKKSTFQQVPWRGLVKRPSLYTQMGAL